MKNTFIALMCALIFVGGVARAQEDRTLTVGTLGHFLDYVPIDVAQGKGWLTEDGFTINVIPFKSGRDCSVALLEGAIDAALIGIDHGITGMTEGRPVKALVMCTTAPGWSVIVDARKADAIRTPADLRGRPLGVTSPGSASDILLTYFLSRYGISPDGFSHVKAGVATMPDIMASGGIDAAMMMEPYATQVIESGAGRILKDFRSPEEVRREFGSPYPIVFLQVNQSVIDAKPQTVQRLVNVLVWSLKWLQNASAEDVLAAMPQGSVDNPATWLKSFQNWRGVLSPDGQIDPDGIRTVMDAQVVYGKIKSVQEIDLASLYDVTFWQAAVETAGPDAAAPPVSGEPAKPRHLLPVAILIILAIGWFWLVRLKRRRTQSANNAGRGI